MSSDPSVSVQFQIRPGKAHDLYYMNEDTALKQAFPVVANTRFSQEFTNKVQGSSTFIIPPQNGICQVIAVLGFKPRPTPANANGMALPRGWGYSAISRLSVRYGGSSQYFFDMDQVLQRTLRQCPNGSARDAILQLGGEAISQDDNGAGPTGTDLGDKTHYAYVMLNLPHTATTVDGTTTTVLPSDLLNQQTVITAELQAPFNYISVSDGANFTVQEVFPSLDIAYFQVQQMMFDDQQDSLARRMDMNTHFYTLPLPSFDQQKVVIPSSTATAAEQSITLTGFRNGQVRSIQLWLTRDGDTSGSIKNPFKWYNPDSITVLYAGAIYAQYKNGSSQLWNLLNGRQQPSANNVAWTNNAAATAYTAAASLMQWVELPFGEPTVQESFTNVLVAGLEVRNGIINLQLSLPEAEVDATNDWKINVVYVYNSSLLFSKATCDYAF
jgi:hypothetical protein